MPSVCRRLDRAIGADVQNALHRVISEPPVRMAVHVGVEGVVPTLKGCPRCIHIFCAPTFRCTASPLLHVFGSRFIFAQCNPCRFEHMHVPGSFLFRSCTPELLPPSIFTLCCSQRGRVEHPTPYSIRSCVKLSECSLHPGPIWLVFARLSSTGIFAEGRVGSLFAVHPEEHGVKQKGPNRHLRLMQSLQDETHILWIVLCQQVSLVRIVPKLVESRVIDHVLHVLGALAVAPLSAAAWERLGPSACAVVFSVLLSLPHV